MNILYWFLSPKDRYIHAMLKAIDKARKTPMYFNELRSKTNGLRVIRRFEKVNGIKFDPFSEYHLSYIAGNAVHEEFFRKIKRVTAKGVSNGK